MRVLAIDFGKKRLGLALCDPTGTIAAPLPPLLRQGQTWWDELQKLLIEKQVEELVVGLPLNMDGSEGASAQFCRKFAEDLKRRFGLPVILLDERLTSVAASSALSSAGLSSRQQRGKLDSMAASLLLQVHLQRKRQV